jgi:hypothetical protein
MDNNILKPTSTCESFAEEELRAALFRLLRLLAREVARGLPSSPSATHGKRKPPSKTSGRNIENQETRGSATRR